MALDDNGLHVGRPASITTWTRRRVEPLALKASDVCIEDIARALSRQCRYNGHVGGFFSVARHSLWVADKLSEQGYSARIQLAGLLHDASEAYLGDVPRPLKQAPELESFRFAEARAELVISKTFSLPYPFPDQVHEADRLVFLERELDDERWTWDTTPARDEVDFLERFAALTDTKLSTRKIVGLVGYAGSGKDTAAIGLSHIGWRRHAFASALKNVARDIGWNGEKDRDGRVLLQHLGCAVRDHVDPDSWVNALERDVASHARHAVLTDVRFPNEIEWLRSRGGTLVRIDRPGVGPVNDHVSEHAWTAFEPDAVIVNDGTPEALQARLQELVA